MPDDRELRVAERHELNAHPDAALSALAASQHGVVARWQLAAIGVSLAMQRSRIASGHLLPRTRRGPGYAAVRAVLADHRAAGASLTRSELEDRFFHLIDEAGLPRPRTNATVERYEVDAFWAAQRLVVELDGWAFHRTRTAFERDRAKADALKLCGYVVLQFTHRDVTSRPDHVVATIRAAQNWR
jgi:very-short-patch-repair endonuclease